jgi:hypothetical protein
VLLAFYAKDIKPGVYTNRVRTIDVFPTLTEILFNEKFEQDGKTLRPFIYENKKEPNRFAFSSIWVTDMSEAVRKVGEILKKDRISLRKNVSSKYSAADYLDDYKCEVVYRRFKSRNEKQLIKDYSERLYRIRSPVELKPVKNEKKTKKMVALINKYNAIRPQQRRRKEKMLRNYFNLLGYRIGS